MDATYRADLRELNELNFARFDAKLEQRLAEQDARWGAQLARIENRLGQRVTELDTSLTRLMFRFWLGTLVPLAGLIIALQTLIP